MSATQMSGVVAPVVDGVFFSSLLYGDETVQWLRGVELEMRALKERVRAAIAVAEPVATILGEVQEQIERFLDEERGELRRSVRRPLGHLRSSAPARRRLERVAAELHSTAGIAISTAQHLTTLSGAVGDLRKRYGPSLPNFTAQYISGAGLEAERLSKVRSERDVQRYEQRLRTISQALGEMEAAAQSAPVGNTTGGSPEGITINELRAIRTLALRARASIADEPNATVLTRETAAGLLRVVDVARNGGANPRRNLSLVSPETNGIAATLVEDAAVRSLHAQEIGATSTATFWSGAVAAAARALDPVPGRFAWIPPMSNLANEVHEAATQVSGSSTNVRNDATTFCIPIGWSHVLLSPDIRGAVRVYSDTIRIGRNVECTVIPTANPVGGSELIDTDVAPLFTGLDEQYPRWYRTGRRVLIRVVARDGDEWYGRIEERGRIDAMGELPANATPPRQVGGAFRVPRDCTLGAATQLEANDRALRLLPRGSAHAVLSLSTRQVATPFERHPTALVRRPARLSRRSREAVSREHAMFSATNAVRPDLAPVCATLVGVGHMEDSEELWPCYGLPPVAWPPRSALEEAWVRSDAGRQFGFLRSVAAVLQQAHEAGFSVGVVTFEQFAVLLDWSADSGRPMPRPLLMTAPLAAPFRKTYLGITAGAAAGDAATEYSRLGASVFPPDVAGSLQASDATDAYAFALFALDLLLKEPLRNGLDGIASQMYAHDGPLAGLSPDVAAVVEGLGRALLITDLGVLDKAFKSILEPDASWASWRSAIW